jgi:hypothetical protein
MPTNSTPSPKPRRRPSRKRIEMARILVDARIEAIVNTTFAIVENAIWRSPTELVPHDEKWRVHRLMLAAEKRVLDLEKQAIRGPSAYRDWLN